MKKIIGLDIGTNSIGAALINIPEAFEDYGKEGNIEWIGSRIIPMDGDYLQKFQSGAQSQTKAAARRIKRGSRRLKHRYKLRRTRLTTVFRILGWLNDDFPKDFKKEKRANENFKFSIGDHLPFSNQTIVEFNQIIKLHHSKPVPDDWIIYYLRKKALTEKITLQELARIIYMFNQRRGFKSSRKDLKDEDITEKKWVETLKIKTVLQDSVEKNKKGNFKFIITPYNEGIKSWTEERKKKPDWEEKEFTFLITEKIDAKGNKTQLKPQLPKQDDWILCITAQDNEIKNLHPGEYFFNKLVENPNFKIRQHAIYRWRYENELDEIWRTQIEKNEELKRLNSNKDLIREIAEKLYHTQAKFNMPKLNELLSKDLLHIIHSDIIYYQRDLKSQKKSIGECSYEKNKGIDGENYGSKCTPKSNPLFQEFRIWQDIHNLKIIEKEQRLNGFTKIDQDVTPHFISVNVKEDLFSKFNSLAEISQTQIFQVINNYSDKKISDRTHRINLFYTKDKKLKGNETKDYFRKIFRKCDYELQGEELLNDTEKFQTLWDILYSISSTDADKSQKAIANALAKQINRKGKVKAVYLTLPDYVIEKLSSAPEIENSKKYASYSAKAIKKLLPTMRIGKYWNDYDINIKIKQKAKEIAERLHSIEYDKTRIGEIVDDEFPKQIVKSFIDVRCLTQGLNTYQACYLVYDRHSEKNSDRKYEDIEEFDVLKLIPNNSLRNPVVEQVIREALFLVKDIWRKYGRPNEIHVELGRELKKNTREKEEITKSQNKNFEEKQRIKELLKELMNDSFEEYDLNNNKVTSQFSVKPHPESPIDIDKFRIWQSLSGLHEDDFDKELKNQNREKIPNKQKIKEYALWLAQNCRSPYTGKVIPLSKLFDKTEYEIEHIIPKSKIKNDSFNNLVIAEAAINPAPYKGNMLARNFINHFGGEHGRELVINGRTFFILGNNDYERHCKEVFRNQKGKLKNLLATEVPEDFVERQLNDTRYITRKIAELLYPIAQDKEGIVFTGGIITSELKKEWGLNKEWKKLLLPRFLRLEKITSKNYVFVNKYDANDININVPENPELDLKRLDHRHHALDALVIASTTREHIRYLNTLNSVDTNEELRNVQKTLVKKKIREFKTPWDTFTEDARHKLEETIVSFKVNNKITSKPYNRFTKWNQRPDGTWEKIIKTQKSNPKWFAVRKSMFKEPQGIIYLKEVYAETKINKAIELQINRMIAQDTLSMNTASYVYDKEARQIIKSLIEKVGISIHEKDLLLAEIRKYLKNNSLRDLSGNEYRSIKIAHFVEYAAKRVPLDKSFDHKKIDKIPYTKSGKSILGKLLHEHLRSIEYNNDSSIAFSGEGIEALSKKNKGLINKVTILEQKNSASKFGNQYVEIDAGSNAYFIIYENTETKSRDYFKSLATHKAIERLAQGEAMVENKEGYKKIILSPNDLVYVPTKAELERIKQNEKNVINWNDKRSLFKGIYRMNNCTETECKFVPHSFINQNPILDQIEFGANNINERAWDGDVKLISQLNKKNEITSKREDSGTMIKKVCIKLKIDRLGNIQPFYSPSYD